MNILYCGDERMKEGLLVSILSIRKQIEECLQIYVMTMRIQVEDKRYAPISGQMIDFLDELVKEKNPDSFVKRLDMTEAFISDLPERNLKTRFTPYCMLRLWADKAQDLPDRILYLDTDVVCRRNFREFYEQELEGVEFVGVTDYFGRWFPGRELGTAFYVNSGVLLLNMKMIRQTQLMEKCRRLCREKRMFLPDQTALNRCASVKKVAQRRFNEQRKLREDTVLQHFTTSFRMFPWMHFVTVKPWQVEKMHEILKLHEYDDILGEFLFLKEEYL